ncbi:hemerythrin domain-containing protein [Maritalea sp.]|uniref:hemerythrin domain-containing protein n=1 Tax=Maritalea sp. TaxID=2003361 RepID=UPI003EF89808
MSNPRIDDLLAGLRKNHHDKHALCDRLEEIADALPDKVDRNVCVSTARAIEPILKKAHQYEEETLFPALKKLIKGADEQAAIFERLKIEHHEDLCFGEEVRDVLASYGTGKPMQTADATGYMLRGFFESLRRHMAIEQELVLPLKAQTKTAPDYSSSAVK